MLPPLYPVLDREDRPSVLDQSAIRHGDDLGHRVQEFTASITVGSIRLLATNLITAGSATAARNRRACLPAYRPSGVPLTSTEPDETTGAPPRRL